LHLNPDKTELIWLGSKTRLKQLFKNHISLQLGAVMVKPERSMRDLGVLIDSEQVKQLQINRIASTCFYQQCRLRQLRSIFS
jgi:hypothetical protein